MRADAGTNINGIVITARGAGWLVATYNRWFASLDDAKAFCAGIVHRKCGLRKGEGKS